MLYLEMRQSNKEKLKELEDSLAGLKKLIERSIKRNKQKPTTVIRQIQKNYVEMEKTLEELKRKNGMIDIVKEVPEVICPGDLEKVGENLARARLWLCVQSNV